MRELHRRALAPLALLPLIFAAGCTMRLADMSAISTRNVNLDRLDLDRLEGKRVVGEDSSWIILIVPTSFPHLEDAVDDALDKGGGDLLTDAVVRRTSWWFLIGQETLTVEGTVVDTSAARREGS